eukprot:COSAG03_NODE_7452_length_916_cov_24.466340_1_plen_145_part_00
MDLLKGNNVWEPADRTVAGELRTVPWSDIARFFTLPSADAGSIDVDLLKGNNVWEPADRTVAGELRTVPWSDIARFFTLPSADAARPTKRARSCAGVARPTAPTTAPSAQLPLPKLGSAEPVDPQLSASLIFSHRTFSRSAPAL